MGAVTYSNPAVENMLNNEVVAIQLPHDIEPQATAYSVSWTPALYILDATGLEHYSTVGFLPPDEFICFLSLGIAQTLFDQDRFTEAMGRLQTIIARYPQSLFAPAAVYLRGVSRYKGTGDVDGLIEAWDKLSREFPGSEWTRRAEPYRLLRRVAA